MADLKSFQTDDDVPINSLVWFKLQWGDSLRLGRVVGGSGHWLIVQIGPNDFDDVIVQVKWKFYKVDPLR